MPFPDLIAYIPTLNQRHLDWFDKHRDSNLLLIDQSYAQMLLPRLERNMAALPTRLVAQMIASQKLVLDVRILQTDWEGPCDAIYDSFILPDEDISHLVAEKYLLNSGCQVSFEMIWARWDMRAVVAEQPVIPDVEVSMDEFAQKMIRDVRQYAERSPDWWRQVGAAVTDRNGRLLAIACNTHVPNEYETYIFGDPAVNRDAGQRGKSCARHAEMGAIAECARHGLAVEGGSIYVSTFPCEICAPVIADAGVREVYYQDGYSSLNALDTFRSRNVKLIQVKSPGA